MAAGDTAAAADTAATKMKIALIVIVFVLVTLGPLVALWLRASFGKPPSSRPNPPEAGPDDDD
jgi:hypothetical protein